MWLSEWLRTFRRTVVPLSSGSSKPREIAVQEGHVLHILRIIYMSCEGSAWPERVVAGGGRGCSDVTANAVR